MHSWLLGQRLDEMSVNFIHIHTLEAVLGRNTVEVIGIVVKLFIRSR